MGFGSRLRQGQDMNKATKVLGAMVLVLMVFLFSGCASPEQPLPQVTVPESIVVTQSAVASDPSNASAAVPTTPSSVAKSSVKPSAVALNSVDADKFIGITPGNYYFSSPSGNLYCGIFGDGSQILGGCQSQTIVKNLPECDDPMRLSGPMISLVEGGGIEAGCTSEGVFVDEVANVLEYGQQLTIGTTTCSSHKTGVSCKSSKTGAEFLASKNSFSATE